MNNTDCGQAGQVETFGDNLGANDDIDISVVEFLIALIEAIFAGNVAVKAGDGGLREELLQFALN